MLAQPAEVKDYLAALPEDRKPEFMKVYNLIRENLPEGYEEAFSSGMVVWQIPLSVRPKTYNGQPLSFGGLANQKNKISLYLTPVYAIGRFKHRLEEAGKKLDMGKSCIRYKRADDLPLDAIAEIVRACTLDVVLPLYDEVPGKVHDGQSA